MNPEEKALVDWIDNFKARIDLGDEGVFHHLGGEIAEHREAVQIFEAIRRFHNNNGLTPEITQRLFGVVYTEIEIMTESFLENYYKNSRE